MRAGRPDRARRLRGGGAEGARGVPRGVRGRGAGRLGGALAGVSPPARSRPALGRAPWQSAPPGAIAVVIDPGRAFGTGAHPTTRLCLELLCSLEPRGGLVDLGCGSGVIAIAAAALGFDPVIACDRDPVAVEATRANAARNTVAVEARELDVTSAPLPEVPAAVANIALAEVAALGAALRSERVVTSGYRAAERPALEGFKLIERRELDGWAAELLARA